MTYVTFAGLKFVTLAEYSADAVRNNRDQRRRRHYAKSLGLDIRADNVRQI